MRNNVRVVLKALKLGIFATKTDFPMLRLFLANMVVSKHSQS